MIYSEVKEVFDILFSTYLMKRFGITEEEIEEFIKDNLPEKYI